MKAIKKFTEQDKPVYKLVDTEEPKICEDYDVKIKVKSIGICTSDIHVLHGAMKMPDGNTVGHEFSGDVVEIGSKVTKVKPGDRIICELAKGACMTCKMCKSGHYELCPEKTPPGWVSQGVYAEYTVQPEYCIHKISDTIDYNVAALAEPLAITVYACIERAKINPDGFTVMYGLGSIGLLTLITILDYGVKNVICIDPSDRKELALQFGAAKVLSPDDDIEQTILNMNDGWMADCVIDCSGAPSAINEGISLLSKNGKYIAIGLTSDDKISFAYNQAVLGVIEMIFSATSSHDSWVKTTGILERNIDKIKKVVSHSFPLEEWEKAYQKLNNREAVKAVLINQ